MILSINDWDQLFTLSNILEELDTHIPQCMETIVLLLLMEQWFIFFHTCNIYIVIILNNVSDIALNHKYNQHNVF